MSVVLPDSIGTGETPEQRYARCVRWYNTTVTRYNAAVDTWKAADEELKDAGQWLDEAKNDLTRAGRAIGSQW